MKKLEEIKEEADSKSESEEAKTNSLDSNVERGTEDERNETEEE